MLRAFVLLSDCLNLTQASRQLGATRQTVRRHITDLETIKGGSLFELDRQGYALTPLGRETLPDARDILRKIDHWVGTERLARRHSNGLEIASFVDGGGRTFFSQQHPINSLGMTGLPIMKRALAAWGGAGTQIEHPAMADIRPYLVIYRKSPEGWICVEIGEKSAYARWFGWTWSKSAIGRLSHDDNAGDDFNDFIAGAYAGIYQKGGVRLDHLFAYLPSGTSDQPIPVSFQRLLLGCVLPDGTPALAVLVLMTNQVRIDDLPPDHERVPDDLVMEFDI
ncbi:LysR family transcriptional regulator [Primorskyibacter aestuariivivens]|uniref:LysR family transcriptional regulator n=1 Tax=Primorskyibacter aestuariivivens TaxID=1888912 RepID=UPI0023009B96|nr:LysR family transcriptional regulator [Primorskyibacter aestuariivivens]MDA7429572.1 LysR family transcriptional regulator [Primorskyibacter aestuariivivens]